MPFHKLQKGGKIWLCLPWYVFRTWDSSSQPLSFCAYLNSVKGQANGQIIDMLESVYGNSKVGSIIVIITTAICHRITTQIHYS